MTGRLRLLLLLSVVALALPGCVTEADAHRRQQRGMALPTWDRDGYGTSETDTALRQIADIGAGWVQIVPTWYQSTHRSSEIGPGARGTSDTSIRKAIRRAHDRGLQVLLKPHVDPLDDTDRSAIEPDDRAAWFASYTTFIAHYAQLAAELDVEQFAVGTELSGVDRDRGAWLRVIKAVEDRYSGLLVYAASQSAYSTVAFWDAVDVVGIDAYWPLVGEPTTDIAALKRSWQPIRTQLAEFAARTGHRILFTELGYASQRGTTTAPWSWTLSSEPDQTEQAAAYQAALETFSDQSWWAGVFWWVWAVVPAHTESPSEPLGFSARDKAAAAVVREWWAAGAGGA